MTKDPFKAVTGLGITGMFALVALHGEAFWRSAMGAWNFLLAITTTAPLGVASFFVALIFSTMTTIALKKRLPPWRNQYTRAFFIETLAFTVGIYLATQQIKGTSGILIGILAGFMASYTAKGVMMIAVFIGNAWRGSPSPPGDSP